MSQPAPARHTADTITDDELDQLYARLATAEQRAEAMTRAMESTAADALKHRGCHRDLMGQCLRAERAEAERDELRDEIATAGNKLADMARKRDELQQRGDAAEAMLARLPRALPAVRRALDSLPARCRYHGEDTDPRRPSYGAEACCDTGVPAQRRKLAEQALTALANLETP